MENRKRIVAIVLVLIVAMSLTVPALASGTSGMAQAVKDGFDTAATDTIDMLLAIIPIGLSIFVLVWGIRKAMEMLKASSGGGK